MKIIRISKKPDKNNHWLVGDGSGRYFEVLGRFGLRENAELFAAALAYMENVENEKQEEVE